VRRQDYTDANREAWDQAAPVHARQKLDELLPRFAEPGHSCLDAIETAILEGIGIAGKAVAQLCCNNGRELLSVKNLGAGRCVGFDASPAFIDQARRLAAAGAIDCSFVATDAYAIGSEHDARFDLVTITVGVLGWMPDLEAFLSIAARLLRGGGRLFIYEAHPVLGMFEPGDPEPLALRHSYFRREPFRDTSGLDYWSRQTYDSKPMYWFQHTLAAVIGGCIAQGLAIESFAEYEFDNTNNFGAIENQTIRPPMTYTLVARRHA
jgi:ubiquinone/menaquinone biosynthesis C-methylase UbiE